MSAECAHTHYLILYLLWWLSDFVGELVDKFFFVRAAVFKIMSINLTWSRTRAWMPWRHSPSAPGRLCIWGKLLRGRLQSPVKPCLGKIHVLGAFDQPHAADFVSRAFGRETERQRQTILDARDNVMRKDDTDRAFALTHGLDGSRAALGKLRDVLGKVFEVFPAGFFPFAEGLCRGRCRTCLRWQDARYRFVP